MPTRSSILTPKKPLKLDDPTLAMLAENVLLAYSSVVVPLGAEAKDQKIGHYENVLDSFYVGVKQANPDFEIPLSHKDVDKGTTDFVSHTGVAGRISHDDKKIVFGQLNAFLEKVGRAKKLKAPDLLHGLSR